MALLWMSLFESLRRTFRSRAKLALENLSRPDIDLDGLMQAAFAAYVQANPAARERVEATHLLAQLDDMCRRGVLATA